jgi:hypothetical protein
MKTEAKLGRCRLWGRAGDEAHAILVAAGYNMRLILNHLKELLLPIFWILFLSENMSARRKSTEASPGRHLLTSLN